MSSGPSILQLVPRFMFVEPYAAGKRLVAIFSAAGERVLNWGVVYGACGAVVH